MRRKTLQTGLAASVLFTAFLTGFTVSGIHSGSTTNPLTALTTLFHTPSANANAEGDLAAPAVYRTTISAIRRDYLGTTPDPTRLTYAAIIGMLSTIGDPYTVYWNPAEYRLNMETTSGDFVGIGTSLDVNPDKKIVVVEVLDDSPAQAAGMQAGDFIVAIDGKATVGLPIQDAVDKIKGPDGSAIKVTVTRDGKTIVFNLKRAVVHSRIVDWSMIDKTQKIGYIQLGMFSEQADIQFDAALQKLEKQGMRALIFDLRENPGGLFQVAQDLASRFVADGPIVWVKEKSGQMSSLNVETDKHRSPLYQGAYPVVVLVNGDSASAAEIVAGAIQDSKAGTLIGVQTYGKGLVQTIMPLADDSAVKITTQHYFTRDQHDINIKRNLDGSAESTVGGITPDIIVPFTDEQVAAQKAAVAANPKEKTIADRYDPQMQKALQVLTDKLAAK